MKDLAVLIPSYNDNQALRETLASIVETENDFTVFIVDDGSEEPVSLTDDYPFSTRVIRLYPNRGIVAALNAGLEVIREEGFRYVARLDAADLNRPGRFRRQYERLQSDPDLGMVGSNVVFRDEESRLPVFTTNLPLVSRQIRRWIVFRNCFIHPAVTYRTDVFDEVGLYDASYPHIEDYVLFSRIVKGRRTVNIEEPLVDCFVRRGGISGRYHRAQMLSGLRFKLRQPRPLDPLWYAYLAKRIGYLVFPNALGMKFKRALGFVRPSTDPAALASRP